MVDPDAEKPRQREGESLMSIMRLTLMSDHDPAILGHEGIAQQGKTIGSPLNTIDPSTLDPDPSFAHDFGRLHKPFNRDALNDQGMIMTGDANALFDFFLPFFGEVGILHAYTIFARS